MNFVKWVRKNNRKIMVFVVIFCMVSFVIGSFGIKILVSMFGGGTNRLIGTYDGGKIKSRQYLAAQNELAVLRMLWADRMLAAQSSQGLSGPLLIHLLFPDSQFAGEIASSIKQAARSGQMNLSQEEVDAYFSRRPERAEILWILLKQEAYRAGCILPTDSAGETLRRAIPAMTGNQLDAAQLVNQIITKTNMSEQDILRTFADLMSVLAYANQVMDSQDVTINQIKASLGRSKERIDAEFVQIPASWFADAETNFSEDQIQQHFNTYKNALPNLPTESNPFGFGYKLGKRVQLEYLVVKLDEVKKLIEKPTADAVESYYSRNISQFQTSVPSDPNNPDSEKITTTRPFAEVEAMIRQRIEDERTQAQAALIFNDIRSQTEAGFESLNVDEAAVEQLQKAAGDYEAAAKAVSQKYAVPVVSGKTGWLTAETFSNDEILGSFSMQRGQTYLRLADLAFAVTPNKPERPLIGLPSIRMWENIGPLSGGWYSRQESKYYRLMTLVRVIGIQEAQTPDSIDVAFDTRGMVLFDQQPPAKPFSLRDKVLQDLRTLRGMEIAKARAEEVAALAAQKGWEEAVKDYNNRYAKAADDPNQITDTQAIEIGSLKQQLRAASAEIETAKRIMQENPASAQYIQQRLNSNMLTNKLYALLPENAESTGTIQKVLPFEPQAACYVVKSVTRKPATEKDYLDGKAQTALQLNAMHSAALPLMHFDPSRILQRMGYQSKTPHEEIDLKTRPEQLPMPDEVL
ncbi:MAG: hypothetical protein KBI46_04100 [Phycisphaerae bacterium]|nr:hypothetical protein [Phycisphaerae bacterium]